MQDRFIPAVFMRGGSSKAVVFDARDLPTDRAERDRVLLGVLGSPDPYGRQLNGMGGGLSSVSKAVIVGPSTRPDADVDYTFAQIGIEQAAVDYGANCGNMSSAVGPFAVDAGLVRVADGDALVRIHQTNTAKIIHARFPVAGGCAVTAGDYAIAGVAGTGARIRLDFLDPGGAVTDGLLPTGRVADVIDADDFGRITLSLVDASNAAAFVDAAEVGLTGRERPEDLEGRAALMAALDRLRRRAGVMMGLGDDPAAVGPSNPRLVIVSAPADFQGSDGRAVAALAHDIAVRMLNMGQVHRAIALTTAMAVGVACRIEGTVAHRLARPLSPDGEIRVGSPAGVVSVGAEVHPTADGWHADSAVVYRTARTLMRGEVAVPA